MEKYIKCYISLPITGKDIEEVRRNVESAKSYLKERGYIPVSPLEVSPNVNATYAEHMGRDIQALLECDAVLFLDGCWESKGCQLEYEAADIYGKRMIFK